MDLFQDLTKEQLEALNKDRLKSKEEGLRPRSFDPYIAKIREQYPLDVANGWSFAEKLFLEEICERFFYETS